MRLVSDKGKVSGLTLIEVLGVVAVLAVLAAMLLPSLSGSRRSPVFACMSQLKQIDLGFQMSAADNGGRFPIQNAVANGGTREFIYSDHVFPHFQKISSLLVQPKLLACPLDKTRLAATTWEALNDLNLSYFLNADISTNSPSRAILAGDRHLQIGAQPVKPGLFMLTANSDMSWIPGRHANCGNLAFVDGHVETSKTGNLNSIIHDQPLATNRLCVP
jgi:prepilin-type processing-associated H-X9-DG protein